jgi:sugar/nucleoside kinase (ribokinase family)
MSDVLVVGDAMVDVHVNPFTELAFGTDTPSSIRIEPGGSGTNIAAWLTYLGLDCHLVASIGQDPFGAFLTERCKKRSIHTHFTIETSVSTGTCVVLIDHAGERSMLPDTGANRAVMASTGADVPSTSHLHVSGYSLAHPAGLVILAFIQAFPGTTSIDLASTAVIPHCDALQEAALLADVAFGTEEEFACLERLPETSVAVIKGGADGVSAVLGSTRLHIPAPDVQVVSTTGAGDAFAAGFLTAWLQDPTAIEHALTLGTECAGQVLTRVAAWPPDEEPGE